MADEVENCGTCGKPVTPMHFMCDETMLSYCAGPCWEVTPCSKGEHGEGCPTMVFGGDDD